MITAENLLTMEKERVQNTAELIGQEDIPQLVEWLADKEDKIRYPAFLLLQYLSQKTSEIYPFWETFHSKLHSENSYQRSIGLMLIAENTRWDTDNRLESQLNEYLALLEDEKPITVRQCIQSLGKIVPYKPDLCKPIASRLMSLDLGSVKETMRKSILLDILNILVLLRKTGDSDGIDSYILHALSGEILDKKSKKQIEELLK